MTGLCCDLPVTAEEYLSSLMWRHWPGMSAAYSTRQLLRMSHIHWVQAAGRSLRAW
jgi:hypothetical protein